VDAIDKVAKALTDETALPNKPRNTIGFTKDIPGPEMEALLKARMPVSEDAMRELSLKRGIAVRDALIAKGLPGARLFLAPRNCARLVRPTPQGGHACSCYFRCADARGVVAL